LLSYSFYTDSLVIWFLNALSLFLTAWVFERRTSRTAVVGITVLSAFLGGLGYALLNQAHPHTPLASPLMISWGYVSAAMVCGVICWKSMKVFEKIILGLALLWLLKSFFPPYGHHLLLVQLMVMAAVALLCLSGRIFKKATFEA
jgi:membrane associated rhomboid family serine protease